MAGAGGRGFSGALSSETASGKTLGELSGLSDPEFPGESPPPFLIYTSYRFVRKAQARVDAAKAALDSEIALARAQRRSPSKNVINTFVDAETFLDCMSSRASSIHKKLEKGGGSVPYSQLLCGTGGADARVPARTPKCTRGTYADAVRAHPAAHTDFRGHSIPQR